MKTIIKKFNKPILQSNWFATIVLTIPRVLCGYFLTANFGGSKFGLPWTPAENNLDLFQVAPWFPEDVAQFGGIFTAAPLLFAWLGAASEAIGGFFLMIGYKTRTAAFFILCTMLVAIFFQKWEQGLWGMLPALGFLWVSLQSLALGSGRLGLDNLSLSRIKKLLFSKEQKLQNIL